MHEIKVSEIIDKDSDQSICFEPGTAAVIQMPTELINKIMDLTRHNKNIFRLKSTAPVYDRLNVKDHLKFYSRWHGSKVDVNNLIHQFNMEECAGMLLGKCSAEMVQRLAYIHPLLASQKNVLAVNPLHNATEENIHMFHKMMEQLKHSGKSLLMITSSTEDAFTIQPDIMKLNNQGLKAVETDIEADEETHTPFNRIKAKSQDKTIFVDLEDIEYIESSEGKVYINISREKFVLDSTLAETEKKLKHHGFYRCHRSYIINLRKAREIITWSKNTYSVVIENQEKTKIPLSRAKYNEIQRLLVMG